MWEGVIGNKDTRKAQCAKPHGAGTVDKQEVQKSEAARAWTRGSLLCVPLPSPHSPASPLA